MVRGRTLAIDKLPGKSDRIAYITGVIGDNIDYACAAAQLSVIAKDSRYKDGIPTTEEEVEEFAINIADAIYRRTLCGQRTVFGDMPETEIEETFYPLVKACFERADNKRAVKNETLNQSRVDPFIAALYGITPDSKIRLNSEDSPAYLDKMDVVIDRRLDPLVLSLHPDDAKVLFGWDTIPEEFGQNKYRGNYNIEGVSHPIQEEQAPEAPTKTILERMEDRLKQTRRELRYRPRTETPKRTTRRRRRGK